MSEWVSLCRMPRDGRLPLFETLLREADIEYLLPDDYSSGVWGAGALNRSRIMVREDRLDEAERLLDQFRRDFETG